jgi:acyl-CoA thioesterase-1
MKRLVAVALFLLLSPLASAAAPVILVMGDSLSAAYGMNVREGWVSLLEQRLRQQGYPHAVVNASVSGETTAGGRTRLPPLLARHQPAVVILELGPNDGLRGLSLTQTRDNLAAMIEVAQGVRATVLLVGNHIPPNYGPDYTRKFHALFADLAERYQTARVPFLLEGVALKPEWMQADGLHPRAVAQPRVLENVWAGLKPLLVRP